MFKINHVAATALLALAFVGTAGSAFAAPTFSDAAPGNGMAIDDFGTQLATFNADDVTDLVAAKTVTVYKYDAAWTDGEDANKAVEMMTNDSQSIGQLREALKANPEAVKLLEEHKIAVDNVVDITTDGAGNVSLYVS